MKVRGQIFCAYIKKRCELHSHYCLLYVTIDDEIWAGGLLCAGALRNGAP